MQNKLGIGLIVGGLLLVLATSLVGWVGVPKIIEHFVKKEFQIRNGSELIDMWVDPPFPVYMAFYIFNITNPDEVEAGETPKLVEAGPYIYRETRVKVDLTQNDPRNPDETIQYKERRTFYWEPENIPGTRDHEEMVNVINIPFVMLVHGFQQMFPNLAPLLANFVLGRETFIRRNLKVGDLIFRGFDVSDITNSLIGPMLPEEFAGGKFGLYRTLNGSDTKIYDIYTGVGHSDLIGTLRGYDGDSVLHWWREGSKCDVVKGGDGSIFPPFVKKDAEFFLFGGAEVCRSLTVTMQKEEEFKDIKVYRFTVPQWSLADPRVSEVTRCFCLEEDVEKCQRAGVFNLDGCQPGANLLLSFPYFLDGDAFYRRDNGLQEADRSVHETYLDVEPTIGAVIRASKKLQVNFDMKFGKGINAYKDQKRDFVFPLMWADERAEIDDEFVDDLKSRFLTPMKIVNIAKWVLLGVGVALFGGGVILTYTRRKRSLKTV